MSEELKPCHRCGSPDVSTVKGKFPWWLVICSVCYTEGPCSSTKEGAEAAWNRRANEGEGHD